MTARRAVVLILAVLLTSCTESANEDPVSPAIDDLAREYLFLELSMGQHDANHVDAYFGPEKIATEAKNSALGLDDIQLRTAALVTALQDIDSSTNQNLSIRVAGLLARLQALHTRIAINRGDLTSFDEESELLFGTTAPKNSAPYFDAILDKIDSLLPGEEPLPARVDRFLEAFTIPADRLPDVFTAAIAECRRRTLEHIELPEDENFTVEYVNDKPWSAYNWYQGNSTSLIQVNTDFPVRITRAVGLGCHEGYPGHHVYNTLLEQNLVRGEGWLEFSLYPLFSPESLIAEGSGNYGINLAFPDDERIEFEKNVLFPLAGLDASTADRYYELLELQDQLSYAGNEAARAYLNGDIDRERAIQWLVKYTQVTPERAAQRTRFFDTYRSYVINYNHGKALVADYIERGTTTSSERWKKFAAMLSTSMLPADLEQ